LKFDTLTDAEAVAVETASAEAMRRIATRALGGIMPALAAITLAACTASAPPPYPSATIQSWGSGGRFDDGSAPSTPPVFVPVPPAPAGIPGAVPSWTHDVATAGMTVGGIEAMQRLKAAQAERAAAKLPAPAVEGAASAAAERKLAGNLLTREGAAVAAGAAERKAAGTLLMRGAVAAEEGEGLWLVLRWLLFL
jgi:hypothetical protein